jgi:DNA repair exonuclease SbcCD ATPase subunit
MADLRIKRIQLRNWTTVQSADISFPDKGLVLVIGSNLASDGKLQSVGSGKTALGEALSRALTGVAGRFANLGHYASDTARVPNTLVKVEAELLSKPLTVEMGFKCPELSKTGEGLRFTYDGKVIQRGHVDQTREELSRTIQVTSELAEWTVFLDGDKLKFNRMSQQDSVNLLMTALAQPPWTEYFERATKVLQDGRRQVALANQALQSAKMKLERLQTDLEDAQQDHNDAKAEYERQVEELQDRIKELKRQNVNDRNSVKAAEDGIAKLKKKIKLLEEQHATAAKELDLQRQQLRDQLALLDQEWQQAVETRSTRDTEERQAQKRLDAMKKVPKNCPTCNKPWDKAHSDEEMKKAEKALNEATLNYQAADRAYQGIKTKREGIQTRIREIQDQMDDDTHLADAKELGEQVTGYERTIRSLNATIQAREVKIAGMANGVDNSFVNKKSAIVEERQRALTAGNKAVETAASDLAGEEQVFKVLEYWHKAFGPTGIPNMVLADAIPPLNRVAQRISNMMTGGTLQVSYATKRELATGDSKAQLIIKVENRIGSKRLEGSSKGESGLTNLIIAENLSEIGQVSNRVGFRWYDEITSGQDAVVRRSIFSYLKEVANKMGILIFVVDHHVEASSYADYVLVAEKTKNEGTRFFWR